MIFCPHCGEEMEKIMTRQTDAQGRSRQICDYLECPGCGQRESVDDTFDEKWQYPDSGSKTKRKE